MNCSPTLVVLAAGMGSRYGGIKQMDPVGPDGEFILDYSVYDAWRAGFKKVVFIVRDELIAPLKEHFGNRLEGKLQVEYVVQSLDELPGGFSRPADRVKPWGTGHAIWCARKAVQGPFAAINADDFYGRKSFAELSAFLTSEQCDGTSCAMVAFQLNRTLSENGTVSRGICTADANGMLVDIVERTAIEPIEGGRARFKDDDGSWKELTGSEPASMNLWAFPDTIFKKLESLMTDFLKNHGTELKAEFYIPFAVNSVIANDGWKAYVRHTPESWFGMTYPQDRQLVLDRIAQLTKEGVYPDGLWK